MSAPERSRSQNHTSSAFKPLALSLTRRSRLKTRRQVHSAGSPNELSCGSSCPAEAPYCRGTLSPVGCPPLWFRPIGFLRAGMRSAVEAGIPAVGILSGQSPEALVEAGASYLIRDYHDLMALVSPSM
mmetsp:Transcript_36221/g.102378  ORF Transcript_36221/g.102378 Transcript_36221/m.102378 type:complete len:128 (+) Transcript_36221:664-1047(+)